MSWSDGYNSVSLVTLNAKPFVEVRAGGRTVVISIAAAANVSGAIDACVTAYVSSETGRVERSPRKERAA